MSYIKLNSYSVIVACEDALLSLKKQIEVDREPMISRRMSGFLGMFKKTREQAVDSLERGGGFSDYHCCRMFWLAPSVCPPLIDLAQGSKDGFVYVDEIGWRVIKDFYQRAEGTV